MSDLFAFFDPMQVVDNTRILLKGAGMTLLLSAASVVLAAVVGGVLGVMRSSTSRPVAWGSRAYVEIIRGTPLLVQMYMLYYGFPSLGITLSAFTAAAVALANNTGAYTAEIVRGAVQSVERSQPESARALGMGYWATYWRVVAPQALPIALPALVGEVVDIVKWSALASVVVVPEATQVVYQIVGRSYRGFGSLFLTLAVFYLLVTGLVAAVSRRVERRMTRYRLRVAHA